MMDSHKIIKAAIYGRYSFHLLAEIPDIENQAAFRLFLLI